MEIDESVSEWNSCWVKANELMSWRERMEVDESAWELIMMKAKRMRDDESVWEWIESTWEHGGGGALPYKSDWGARRNF